eukprot:snap_masked-scaffold_9-processed-gene-11.48-mRNA-1 protein AED:1.00 eAED:1.00 QI:0/0/0/0/1/1/2/0/90
MFSGLLKREKEDGNWLREVTGSVNELVISKCFKLGKDFGLRLDISVRDKLLWERIKLSSACRLFMLSGNTCILQLERFRVFSVFSKLFLC